MLGCGLALKSDRYYWRGAPAVAAATSDLSLGLAADLPAQTLPIRIEPQRDHTSPAPSAGLMKGTVPAVAPVVEVDAVFAAATARSPSHTGIARPDSRIGSPTKNQELEQVT